MMKKLLIVWLGIVAICAEAQIPGWQVDASMYSYSMTIVGMIKTDGVPALNANDQIGAFINGQLRGVATPVFQPSLNRNVFYLLVYSNESTGNITFKYYDADKSVVTNALQTLTFAIDGLTGNPGNPFVWSNRITDKTATFTSYSFPAQYSSQIYNDSIIAISVPPNFNLGSVVTNFTASTGASVFVDGSQIVSGNTIDYTSGVKLVVRSEDEQTVKKYSVKIPTINIALAARPLYDRSAAGIFAGKLTTSGFDSNGSVVYSFGNCSPNSDNSLFSIRKDSLFVNGMVLYYDKPEYDLCIRTTDSHGLYYEKSFHISVQDVNFAPGNVQFALRALHDRDGVGKFVGKMTTTDVDPQDTHVYTLGSCQSNSNNSSFIIRNDSVFTNAVVEYEKNTSLDLCLRTTDNSGLYFEKSFSVPVLDVNFAPTDLTFKFSSLRDYDPSGKFVGLLKAVDPDPRDTYTYELGICSPNTDNGAFTVRNDSVFTAAPVRYVNHSSFSICLKANDSGGLSFEKSFTIPVIDVNFVPTDISIAVKTIYDNAGKNTFVGKLATVDPDVQDQHIYSLGNCSDSDLFEIRNDSVFTSRVIRFFEHPALELCVKTTDNGGLFYEEKFQIAVTDVNFAPTAISFDFHELHDQDTAGTFVGKLTTSDLDEQDVHVYNLGTCGGDDSNLAFVIRNDSVFTSGLIQHDVTPELSICVRSTDGGGLYMEKSFQIPVIDSHDPSDIIIETLTVEEGNSENYFISAMQVVDGDVDDTFTYSLVSGDGDEDNSQFYIENDELYMANVTYYDVKKSYAFRIRVSDAKGTFVEKSFTLTVTDDTQVSKGLPSVNYVSPNDDGINDYWVVKNVEIYQEFSIHIFDQFGNVVFKKENNYQNEWGGKLNGKPLPDGNYFYVFRSSEKVYKGNLTIVNK